MLKPLRFLHTFFVYLNIMRFYYLYIALLVCSISFMSCSMNDDSDSTISDDIVRVGEALPAFTVEMNDGTTLSTIDLKGKPSLIVFFSTTCRDCQRELPNLNERYLKYHTDTTFVAISREQSAEIVSDYWKQHSLNLPYSAQKDRFIYNLFARKGIPRIYISNSNCIIQEIH